MKKPANRTISETQNHLISDALDDFLLAQRVANRSPRTIEYYEENVKHFSWWLTHAGYADDLDAVEPSHVRLFLQYLQTNTKRWDSDNRMARKRMSDSSVQAYFRALRAFFNWCRREQYIEASPFEDKRLPTPRIRWKVAPSYTLDEIDAMLKACQRDTVNRLRDTAIILTLLDTAIRAQELTELHMVDLERGRIKVLGKGNKERYLPLSPTTEKAIRDYVRKERGESGDYLFVGRGTDRLTYDGLREVIRRRGREAGVAGAKLHKFRHTSAQLFTEAGGSLHSLQARLGHSSPLMAMRYGQMVDTTRQVGQYSPVEQLTKQAKGKR